MKKFLIKVNGVAYDVEVEENGSAQSSVPAAAPKASVQAASPKKEESAPAAKKAAPAPSSAVTGSEVIKAPMPGTIMSVSVAVGDAVKKGQLLCVLEAMKMENEISAPRDGEVASVNVSKGASVNSGDPMVSLA